MLETQKRLEGALKAWASWEDVVGEAPKKPQLEGALQGKDAFLYCGHGSSSSKYLTVDEIEKVGLCRGLKGLHSKVLSCLQLRVRAVPVLVGCNSGQLTRQGRSLDPLGSAQSYLMAATPALVRSHFSCLHTMYDVCDHGNFRLVSSGPSRTETWTSGPPPSWTTGCATLAPADTEAELLQAVADKRDTFEHVIYEAAVVVHGLLLIAKRDK